MDSRSRPMHYAAFYAGDCAAQVRAFLEGHAPPAPDAPRIVAAAVPHAGWRYSGAVAARALKTLADRSHAKALVLFGAVHRERLECSAVYPAGDWQTPFGPVEVADSFAAEILSELGDLARADPRAHDSEHSLEVEAPLIHEIFSGVPIVPIMVPPWASPAEVGRRVARAVEGSGARDVVAVASTDLTHYGERFGFEPAGKGPAAHAWMKANDQRMLDLACSLEAERIPAEAERHRNACGPGALAAAAAFARELGSPGGCVLERTDSHEVEQTGAPFEQAVGYAGIVF